MTGMVGALGGERYGDGTGDGVSLERGKGQEEKRGKEEVKRVSNYSKVVLV